MGKPHTYTQIPSLDGETQLYTQRRRNDEPPTNYRFTMDDVMAFLIEEGFVTQDDLQQGGFIRIIPGSHPDDEAARLAGGNDGDGYQLTINNSFNIPVGNGGLIKIIQESN